MVTRIRQLLEEKQLTPTQFADLIGVGRPVVSHILSERNKPSLEVVQRVVEAFPEIALPWLLRGTGPMLAEAEASPTPPATPMQEADEPAAPQNAVAPAAPTPPAQEAPPATPTPALEAQPGSQVVAAPPKVIPLSRPPALPAVAVAVAAALPIAPKAFQAARFVPGAAKSSLFAAPVVSPREAEEVPVPVATAAASPKEAAAPAQSSPEPASMPTPATPTTGPVVPTHLPLPVELGKAIRRIVIFYRDGSFADYQPES